jgi:hypothetical protein
MLEQHMLTTRDIYDLFFIIAPQMSWVKCGMWYVVE